MTPDPTRSQDRLGIGELFSPSVAVLSVEIESMSPDLVAGALFPQEAIAVARAVEKRRREFAIGRWCAREALAALGIPPAPIPVGPNREPRWPAGVVGSIAHNRSHCVAATALTRDVATLGVDIEDAEPLPPELWERCLTPVEFRRLKSGDERAALEARLCFSAKETAFKAQFPLSGAWLDFSDVEIDVGWDDGSFLVTFLKDAAPLRRGEQWAGRWLMTGPLLVSAIERRAQR